MNINLNEIRDKVNIENGKILFDFMLINGNKKNRFIECEVVNSTCKRNTFKLVDSVNIKIKKTSQRFFRSNIELVSKSVLPNSLKYLISTGELV